MTRMLEGKVAVITGAGRGLGKAFPQCLDGAPMLLQGAASALRQRS